MISDWTIASQVNTLEEYYARLYKLHSNAHTPEYMLVHDEIIKHLQECDIYTEFGVNQGATLAAAMLQYPSKVRAYDIALKPYAVADHLFMNFAKQHNIDYKIIESNTLKCVIDPTDLMYIDTLHRYEHLMKELALHSSKVRKYIIFHDTAAQAGLKKAVNDFVNANQQWEIITDCNIHVGFMTIKNKYI